MLSKWWLTGGCCSQGCLACVTDETKPQYSPSVKQWPKACSDPPRVTIIASNWLLHMAVLLCAVIGRVQIHNINTAAITAVHWKLAFEAMKSSSNYLTIFPSNGICESLFGQRCLCLSPHPTGFGTFGQLSWILCILNQNKHAWQESAPHKNVYSDLCLERLLLFGSFILQDLF